MKGIELNMKNGKNDGLFTIFYMQNGQKREEQTWKDGKPDGLRTFWYENGKKEKEGTYKDGKIDGLWTYYNEDGSIKELKQEIKETTPRSWYAPYYRAKKKLRIGGNNE
jgi:antitoxin component YwqK of YwqJK toxin-antitoxin module